MPRSLFRVRLPDGDVRLAAGDVGDGPRRLLPSDVSLDDLLSMQGRSLRGALNAATDVPVPAGSSTLAPVESQEIWAAGVTYERSRQARVEEALEATPYDRVYTAERPELFQKAPAWRARGSGEPIGIRRDSSWNVPEPELALVLDASMRIVGYTIGDDVSSRSIEGENTLYLPQAKSYDGACAIGPGIVPVEGVAPPFKIRLLVLRSGTAVIDETTSTAAMVRGLDDLGAWLGRALSFPVGAILLTGTGVVPPAGFTLAPGDVVRIEVERLGTLENVVEEVGAPEVRPTTSSERAP